ncbi:hypothetical protein Anas_06012 [Armadillidium nasatum]|uniref:Uncharacterized protein n=1 Tax=Armadillidium nasatum TaxID=96803 RepID=A0A5N5TP56_9CRUS|nr:hypothetical protein Anas_06012 [Armadillidium nasatum]
MKSTYSNYKVSGDITTDLDSLKQGPTQSIMDAARTTSEQQSDNTRGPDGKEVIEVVNQPGGVSAPTTGSTDSSTIKRLKKDIKELDSMLEGMDQSSNIVKQTSSNIVIETKTKRTVEEQRNLLEDKTEGKLSSSGKVTSKSNVVAKEEKKDQRTANHLSSTNGTTNSYSYSSKSNDYSTSRIPNGKPGYEDEEVEIKQEPAGEVRKIVWRNRFEKTYEAQDGTPHISIEEESRRKREKHLHDLSSSISINQHHPPAPPQRGPVSPRQLQLQYAVYWPNHSPNISPGGQSWADPIPMPTPPHISPKGEPGVAYVYTYGQNQSGSQVQHLPPLNYVSAPPGTTVRHNDSAPSLSPSSGNQPVIYHYSYHYTLQPGHSLPEGVPQPPGTTYPIQPALQVATPVDKGPHKSGPTSLNSYEYKKTTSSHTSSAVDRSDTTNVIRHYSPERTTEPRFPTTEPRFPTTEPRFPTTTRDGPPYDDRYPRDTEPDSNRNISITINKSSRHVTHTKDYPSGGPSTSTPFPTTGRSRSSSPDRYPRGPGTAPYGTVTHVTRTSYSDSLDRLRKPPHEGLPFPDTSPIRPKDDSKIPRRIDDLMTTLSDSEDGTHRRPLDAKGMNGPRAHSPEKEPLIIGTKVSSESKEFSLSENKSDLKREETKNVAGPPVYYPPGHHQLFDESMHTMTLKEKQAPRHGQMEDGKSFWLQREWFFVPVKRRHGNGSRLPTSLLWSSVRHYVKKLATTFFDSTSHIF